MKLTIGAAETEDGSSSDAGPLDEARGGMGLALPLSRAIITAHGGTVQEQADSAGVTFTVVLATTE